MSTFGPTYDKSKDEPRLTDQRNRICNFMLDYGWKTLSQISATLGYPEASVSAQLRHLRKAEFGAYRVNKRRVTEGGLWEYQVLPPIPSGQMDLIETTKKGALWPLTK